jgi:hypothetical protein
VNFSHIPKFRILGCDTHHQQYSPSCPSHFLPQAYHINQTQPPTYYQSYHYTTTNHPQPLPAPQITYPSPVVQITYPTPNNTNPQVKTETNPPPPPSPQIHEPLQQTNTFPTHGTNLTITGRFITSLSKVPLHKPNGPTCPKLSPPKTQS